MEVQVRKSKKRILFCGVSLSKFSGLGYVASNWALRFANDDFEIGYATFVGGDTKKESIKEWNREFYDIIDEKYIYNCQLKDESKFFSFDNIVQNFKPDIVISCLDPWQLDQIEKCASRDNFYWICYLTIETPKYPTFVMYPTPYYNTPRKDIVKILSNANLIIPVTQMGKKALQEMKTIPEEKKLKNILDDNVYNGIDLTKLPDRKYFKKELFGGVVEESDFIFMTMGKNMERKKLDLIVRAFAKFLEKMNYNKKYKLYLHTDIDYIGGGGTDLYQLIIDLNIAPHILLPISFKQGITMSIENLYKRYSVCDCGILLSSGEGFAYMAAECMINKTPVIYINYGGHAEYLKDIGLPVKVKEYYSSQNTQMYWAIADIDDACKQMCKAVSDVKWKKKAEIKGYEFAKNNFDWNVVYKKFRDIILEKYKGFKKPGIFNFNLKRIV